jgi:lambda family phage tail tape measure protein
MPEYRIKVIIDPREAVDGAEEVEDELEDVEAAAEKVGKALRAAFIVAGAVKAAKEIGSLASEFNNVENQLRTLTESQEQLASVTEELFGIANRTRSEFEATAVGYARVARSAKDLGRSEEELLGFTESLNQAVILSGASAVEANAGLIQLSQGLASGALRGDELRSVLEQLPVVADVIAKSLGVTRGELRELGSEGKITSDIIIDAFAEASDSLQEEFDKSIPTVGQGFTVLRNNALQAVGAIDNATGASDALAQSLIFLGDNLLVIGAAGAVLAVATLPGVIAGFQALIASSATLQAVFAGSLFSPVIVSVGAAAIAVGYLVDQFEEAELAALDAVEAGEKFGLTDYAKVGADILRVQENLAKVQENIDRDLLTKGFANPTALRLAENYREQLESLRVAQDLLADGSASTSVQARQQAQALADLADAVDGVIDRYEVQNGLLALNSREREVQATLLKEVAELEKGDGPDVSQTQRDELEAAIRQNQALSDQADVLERLRGPQEELQADLRALEALFASGTITAKEYEEGLAALADDRPELLTSGLVSESALAGLREQLELTQKQAEAERLREQVLLDIRGPVEELNERQAILNQLLEEGAITAAEYAEQTRLIEEALNPLTEVQQREVDLLESIRGPQEQLAISLEALDNLYAQGKINADEYSDALEKIGVKSEEANTAAAGFASGFEKAKEQLSDVKGAAEDLVVNGLGAAEDAFVEFATTGKASIRDLVDQVIKDLARLAFRQAFAGGGDFLSGLGFGGAKAGGGSVSSDESYLVGEEGPELFKPDQAGEIVPAEQTAAIMNGQKAPIVNVAPASVSVYNVTDPNEVPAGMQSPEGQQIIVNTVRQNSAALKGSF